MLVLAGKKTKIFVMMTRGSNKEEEGPKGGTKEKGGKGRLTVLAMSCGY